MASSRQRRMEASSLDRVEAAWRLLRAAPAGLLLRYYVGAGPCILGLLYFWTDVTHGAFASTHLVESSLGTAALYLWMKCWQAAFCSGLRAQMARQAEAPWTARRVLHMACLQCAVQPSGLFTRLLAANLVLPYPWVYGFYQTFSIFGDGTQASLRECARRAWKQACWTPWEGVKSLSHVHLFALLVWMNVAASFFFLPLLLRIFTGIETIFTRSPGAMLNSTFAVATLGITYLCIDPLRKALYVVRAFHGEARSTGEDLALELALLRAPGTRRLAAIVLAALLLGAVAPAARPAETAGNTAPPPAAGPVESGSLNRSIDEVLARREFTWRMPKEKGQEEAKGAVTRFFEDMMGSIRNAIDRFRRWMRNLGRGERAEKGREGGAFGFFDFNPEALIYIAVGLGLGIAGWLYWKQRRQAKPQLEAAVALEAMPDLRAEDVAADQLPEEGWLRLARQLHDQGELRLALRASYLAGLAHLGQRELIRLARHKSNLDYERELHRRARARAEMLAAFDENLLAFERAWYGHHAVSGETLSGFNANLEKIRTC